MAQQPRRKRKDGPVERAAALLKLNKSGEATMSASQAMLFAGGFTTVERKDKTYQRQVLRKRDKLITPQRLLTARYLQEEEADEDVAKAASQLSLAPVERTAAFQQKKMRQTSRQAHAERKHFAERKSVRNMLFIRACTQYHNEQLKAQEAQADGWTYKALSSDSIVRHINSTKEAIDFDIRIGSRTVRDYVKEGRVGEPMRNPGAKGSIKLTQYKALCAAVKSYTILTQQEGTKARNVRAGLIRQINACVNKREGHGSRSGRCLFERIQRDVADELDLGKPNKIEQRRRNKWSTYYNINLYFNSLKAFLIDNGFAKEASASFKLSTGSELEWATEDQGRRIANIDETALVLDNTEKGKGGRPSAAFYDPKIAACATQGTHKSSYHATMVAGTFASGEKFPEHFQIPSDAKDRNNEGFSVEFIEDMLHTKAQYLHSKTKTFSPSYGVNVKGGMNKEDFGEYILKNFAPLVAPDTCDKPGKRVMLLVDGGPGRTNEEMLHQLRMMGIYLFPSGPPNTTHILQVLDMLFGPFKTAYFDNLESLWEYRQNNPDIPSTITRNDVGLLVYGSAHSIKRHQDPNFPLLQNAVEEAFATEKVQHCWACKLGVYPHFTRVALQSKHIRHEIIVDEAGNADISADPQSDNLRALMQLNQTSCDILDAAGYNGALLRATLSEFSSSKRKDAITQPRTRERQQALEFTKAGGGKRFQRTGGAAYNDDDVIISLQRKSLKAELEDLEKTKKAHEKAWARQQAAFAALEQNESKTPSQYSLPTLKTLISWKLGKPCPAKWKKEECLRQWQDELKDKPTKPAVQWSENQEARIDNLRKQLDDDADIALEDTSYGLRREDQKHQARALIMAMPTPEREAFLRGEDDTSTTEDTEAVEVFEA